MLSVRSNKNGRSCHPKIDEVSFLATKKARDKRIHWNYIRSEQENIGESCVGFFVPRHPSFEMQVFREFSSRESSVSLDDALDWMGDGKLLRAFGTNDVM